MAIAACIGNFLQGWDNATIAGTSLQISHLFNLLMWTKKCWMGMFKIKNLKL